MLAQPCPGEQTTGIAQRGHEYHHNSMRDGMIIECQRHDEAGSQKRNVQHGEHGDRDMAQPAMAYLSLLMVEGGFKSCACIGVGKLIRHGQRDAAAERHFSAGGDRYDHQRHQHAYRHGDDMTFAVIGGQQRRRRTYPQHRHGNMKSRSGEIDAQLPKASTMNSTTR